MYRVCVSLCILMAHKLLKDNNYTKFVFIVL